MTKLDELYLLRTNITDKGLEHLEGLQDMKRLELRNAGLDGSGLVHLQGHAEAVGAWTWPKPK